MEIADLEEKKAVHQRDYDMMISEYEIRLEDLERSRLQADNHIEKLSLDLAASQSEINVLLIEAQKYEGQVHFLMSEREMLL